MGESNSTYQSNTVVFKKMVWVVTKGERQGDNIRVWDKGMWTTMHKTNEDKDILFSKVNTTIAV